jgi:hypothetical protein
MTTLSPALAAHVAGEVTSLATCWRLERTDGWVRGFTDHDRNLVIEGVTYVAATGFLPSAIKSGSDLSVDNLDVDGFLDADALEAEDLSAGLFDVRGSTSSSSTGRPVARARSSPPRMARRGQARRHRFSAEIRRVLPLRTALTKLGPISLSDVVT